mmetsp:Transcript_902/g.2563  ORF Transcript_902/g.2563 Transcript_902/m.2563 type:complete len:92 (-) Transcript_902:60-335(-)
MCPKKIAAGLFRDPISVGKDGNDALAASPGLAGTWRHAQLEILTDSNDGLPKKIECSGRTTDGATAIGTWCMCRIAFSDSAQKQQDVLLHE